MEPIWKSLDNETWLFGGNALKTFDLKKRTPKKKKISKVIFFKRD